MNKVGYWFVQCMEGPGCYDPNDLRGMWLLEGYKDEEAFEACTPDNDALVEHHGDTMFDVLKQAFPHIAEDDFRVFVRPHQTLHLGVFQWAKDKNGDPITEIEDQTLVRVVLSPDVHKNEDGTVLLWDWYMNPNEPDPQYQKDQNIAWVLIYVFGLPEDLPVEEVKEAA
jgi:hypothetical protein